MNNTLKITLIVVAALFGAAILLTGGIVIGKALTFRNAFVNSRLTDSGLPYEMGPGMMGGGFFRQETTRNLPFGKRPGMRGGYFFGQENNSQPFRQGPGMMWRGTNEAAFTGEPWSIEDARTAFETYLTELGNEDLGLHEVMVFTENAYAIVVEKSSGIGAMEVLLDYSSGTVYPEIGPNHMWNQKYGMMAGRGRFGCGAGCNYDANSAAEAEMTINAADAKSAAQAYLEKNEPGAAIDGEGMAFYGYYTFDYSVDGEPAGMLSVNGQNAQVWPHTWHGQFIEEQEIE